MLARSSNALERKRCSTKFALDERVQYSSMGKKDEILGRLFGTWYFALLGTRIGQVGFVWINQETGYARSQAA